MKHCLFQNQWGKEKGRVFKDPPESRGGKDMLQAPEVDIQHDLEDLKESTQRGMSIEGAIESNDISTIKVAFEWHIKTLNTHYFRPEKVAEREKKQYKKNSQIFEKLIQERTDEKLDELWKIPSGRTMDLSSEDAFEETLMNVKNNLTESYKRFAGSDEFIDAQEAQSILKIDSLEKQIGRQNLAENFKMLEGKSEDEAMAVLEAMYYFKPKVWEKTVLILPEPLFKKAEQDVNEGALILLANQMKESDEFDENDFEEVVDYLREEVVSAGKMGPHETIKLLRKIENALEPGWVETAKNGGQASQDLVGEKIETYSKYSLLWKSYYLSPEGTTALNSPYEKALVQFMQGTRKERAMMLRNDNTRYNLFKGIHICKTNYKTEYERFFKSDHAKENDKLREKHGSLGGLVLLAEEAQSIVDHFDEDSEFSGMGLKQKMEQVRKEKGRVIDYKRHKKPKFNSGIPSQLAIQGFNGRDLTLAGVKVAAMASFLVNGVNTINSAAGNNIFERMGNGLKDMALLKNPTIALSAAVVLGVRTLEKNKYFFDYFSVGGYEQEGMKVSFKLGRMAEKIGRNQIERYIRNPIEWRMMAELQEEGGHEKVKELLKMAQARRREKKSRVELITKEDLKGVIKDETYQLISNDPLQANVRYEFLNRFLSSSNYLEIHTLKELCIGNSYIKN